MSQIIVKQNINKDAWNWWHACNRSSYGVDWKNRVSKDMQKEIVGKSQKASYSFLIPHIKKLYKESEIIQGKINLKKVLSEHAEETFSCIERITGHKMYRDDFTIIITTFPRAAYDFKNGSVWIPIIWPPETYIRTLMHELLHFQTYAFWENKCLKKIGKPEFEELKEALTVILNEECLDLMIWRDKGYESHKDIRKKLLRYWKNNKNYDKIIAYGVSLYEQKIY